MMVVGNPSEGRKRGVSDGLLEKLAQTDFPRSENIRRVLACLADLSRYGLERLTVRDAVHFLKIDFIKSMGYREYLYVVLRGYASHPTRDCRLWRNSKEIKVESDYWASQPLVAYLTYLESHNGLNNVPDRVTFQTGEDEKLTRYI